MVQRHELEAAYFHDLRAQEGMDPEVARDLGYVTSPEDFDSSLENANAVKRAMSSSTGYLAPYAELTRAQPEPIRTTEHLTTQRGAEIGRLALKNNQT